MPSTPVSAIPLPASGIVLEYKYHAPVQNLPGRNGLAVLLHPWSRLGGTFNDPCVRLALAIRRETGKYADGATRPIFAADERGYHVLRYNARGVGKSSGSASWTGLSEGQDLQEFVQWALGAYPDASTLLLIGYSHGALISSLYPVLPTIRTLHVLLSYPLSPRGALTLFRSGTYTSALVRLLHTPKADVLVVYGTRDDFTSAIKYERWVGELKGEVEKGGGVARLEVQSVEGANHFWRTEARERLIEGLEGWLDRGS